MAAISVLDLLGGAVEPPRPIYGSIKWLTADCVFNSYG